MEERLAKYFSEEASLEEKAEVEKWRGASESNTKSFLEAKEVWLASSVAPNAQEEILRNILEDSPRKRTTPILMRSWIKYASAAVLVLALSLLFYLNQSGVSEIPTKGLADGSLVALHEDSKMEVIRMNEDVREVKITGKGYFQVARDVKRPFVIQTALGSVRVLGTSFVVDASGGTTSVTVESGRVELRKNEDVAVELVKGETGFIDVNNEGIIKKPNNDANYLAWKTRKIIFEEASMQEVREVIEDVYGVEVVFEDSTFSNCTYTATLDRRKIKDVLEIISRTFNLEYNLSKDKAILKGKGC